VAVRFIEKAIASKAEELRENEVPNLRGIERKRLFAFPAFAGICDDSAHAKLTGLLESLERCFRCCISQLREG